MLLAENRTRQLADAEKLAWIDRAQSGMRDAFQSLSSQSLRENSAQLVADARLSIIEPLGQKLSDLDRSVRDLEQKREGAYAGVSEQIRNLLLANQSLQQQTVSLSTALRSSQVRGRWGEIQLRRIAELSGMDRHISFSEQVSIDDESKPDMIVHLPNQGQIVLDAKTPMSAWLESIEAVDDGVRQAKLLEHSKAVRSRIRDLNSKKYWEKLEGSAEFVVMFMPSEAVMSAAFAVDPALFDEAIAAKVIIATPATLLALLKSIALGWQQVHLSENARHIADEAQEMYKRLTKAAELVNKFSRHLRSTVDAHNEMIGSLQGRVLPSLRRLKSFAGIDKEIEFATDIDVLPRELPAASFESDD
ncbi:MAG: DNA recombination protein RmuC [Chloroflexi bacterium]|nr:DNA recombination protein RmuC [Chloroflexota bacterium]